VTVTVALVCGLAVALDRAAGPGRYGRDGSTGRGVALGSLGSLVTLVLAFTAVHDDLERAARRAVGHRVRCPGHPDGPAAGVAGSRPMTDEELEEWLALVGFGR
jgi:hypothetical protein